MNFQRITPNIHFEELETVASGQEADQSERLLDLLDMELSGTKASQSALLQRVENVLRELTPYTTEQQDTAEDEVFETFTFATSTSTH
jgi:hypothetical protein